METRPAGNIEGLATAQSRSGQRLVALATYDGGVYISSDSGVTWTARNVGLKSTHLWDVAIADMPGQQAAMFAVSNRSFLSTSETASEWQRNEITASGTWKFLSDNLDEGSLALRLARRLMAPPKQSFPTQIAVSPSYAADGTVFLGTRYQGILKSNDKGSTWEPAVNAPEKWAASVKISPGFLKDSVVAACYRSAGFYMSTDGGAHWIARNNGISEAAVRYPNLGSNVVEFSPTYASDETIYFGTADGLYLSRNRADSWRRLQVTGGNTREHIKTVAVAPDRTTILVSIKGRGLFRSTDRGVSFSEVARDLIREQYVLKLIRYASDYITSKTIFGASAEEAFISHDAGGTWQILQRPVRYEDTKENLFYHGSWEIERKSTYSASSIRRTRSIGAKVDIRFAGTGFVWYGPKSEEYGEANIYVDGTLRGRANQFQATREDDVAAAYALDGLANTTHVLTIENVRNSDDQAGPYIGIDAIEVF